MNAYRQGCLLHTNIVIYYNFIIYVLLGIEKKTQSAIKRQIIEKRTRIRLLWFVIYIFLVYNVIYLIIFFFWFLFKPVFHIMDRQCNSDTSTFHLSSQIYWSMWIEEIYKLWRLKRNKKQKGKHVEKH